MQTEEKRKACKIEIDRLKQLQVNPDMHISQCVPSKGLLKISNLSIPLRKEFVELRARGKGVFLVNHLLGFANFYSPFSFHIFFHLPSHQWSASLRVRAAGHLQMCRQGHSGVQV